MIAYLGARVIYVESEADQRGRFKAAIITQVFGDALADLHVFEHASIEPFGHPVKVIKQVRLDQGKKPGSWHWPPRNE